MYTARKYVKRGSEVEGILVTPNNLKSVASFLGVNDFKVVKEEGGIYVGGEWSELGVVKFNRFLVREETGVVYSCSADYFREKFIESRN